MPAKLCLVPTVQPIVFEKQEPRCPKLRAQRSRFGELAIGAKAGLQGMPHRRCRGWGQGCVALPWLATGMVCTLLSNPRSNRYRQVDPSAPRCACVSDSNGPVSPKGPGRASISMRRFSNCRQIYSRPVLSPYRSLQADPMRQPPTYGGHGHGEIRWPTALV